MTLERTKQELQRLDARDVRVELDEQFDREAGTLIRVEIVDSYWHLLPEEFLQLLAELPDGAGSDAVTQAIERESRMVWHGPEPGGSRDT